MTPSSSMIEPGKAVTINKIFSRETSISIEIRAEPSIIWGLLTTASDFPVWNSTVISINGKIALGEKISLKSILNPKRWYNLNVKEFQVENKLVWGDAMGRRVYTLNRDGGGAVLFSMTEKIGGPLFPFFARMIPPFDRVFEQFAIDLKIESEKIMNLKQFQERLKSSGLEVSPKQEFLSLVGSSFDIFK
jgi:hypothetical protein